MKAQDDAAMHSFLTTALHLRKLNGHAIAMHEISTWIFEFSECSQLHAMRFEKFGFIYSSLCHKCQNQVEIYVTNRDCMECTAHAAFCHTYCRHDGNQLYTQLHSSCYC